MADAVSLRLMALDLRTCGDLRSLDVAFLKSECGLAAMDAQRLVKFLEPSTSSVRTAEAGSVK